MRQVTDLKEIQSLGLKILSDVDMFCQEHGITYFLAYGTLLGAIRHGGFIPWDDDIDIWIKREDYNRLVDAFPEWGASHGLYLNSPKTVHKYNRPHSQICLSDTVLLQNQRDDQFEEGYYIDVFPIDGLPANAFLRWLRIKHLQFLKNICTLSAYTVKADEKKTFKKKILLLASRLFKNKDTQKTMLRYEKVAGLNDCSSSAYLQIIAPGKNRGRNMVLPATDFQDLEIRRFEGMLAAIPCGYDDVLSKLYGDYMTPPPEDQRKPHHDFRLYYKE